MTAGKTARLRPFDPDRDSTAVATLQNVYSIDKVTSEEVKSKWEKWPSDDPRFRLVATDDQDEVVGTVHARRHGFMKPGLFMVNLFVLPGSTGHGIGSVLSDAAHEWLSSEPCSKIWAFVPDDNDRGRLFAERRDYRIDRHLFGSVLDASKIEDGAIESAIAKAVGRGYRFLAWAETPQGLEETDRLFAVHHDSDRDEPVTKFFGLVDRPFFETNVLGAEWFRPEGCLIAEKDGVWVGIHILGPTDEGDIDMVTDYTGVFRPHRGSGVATALKMLGVRYAKSLGRSKILTSNDSANLPMLAINRRMGFEPNPGWLIVSKELEQ